MSFNPWNKFIGRLAAAVQHRITADKIRRCDEQVTKGARSRFYEEASIANFAKDRKRIIIGSNTHIRGELLIWPYSQGIEIGSNCYIGANSRIWSGEKITIGNDVLISHNVNIFDTDSHEIDPRERAEGFVSMIARGHASHKGNVRTAAVTIGDHAWISFNVCILKGVKIGRGAVIGAGAVVTQDIPDNTMAAGNPARIIKQL